MLFIPRGWSLANFLKNPNHLLSCNLPCNCDFVKFCIHPISLNICIKTILITFNLNKKAKISLLWTWFDLTTPSIFLMAFLMALMHFSQCMPTFSSTNYTESHAEMINSRERLTTKWEKLKWWKKKMSCLQPLAFNGIGFVRVGNGFRYPEIGSTYKKSSLDSFLCWEANVWKSHSSHYNRV